jgi:hypothetical protein
MERRFLQDAGRARRRDLSFAAAFLLAVSAAAAAGPGTTDEFRRGVAPGADFRALLDKPEVTEMEAEPWKDSETGEHRIAGWSELHGVFEVPFEAIVRVLTDYEGQPRYSPRLFSARVESREGSLVRVSQNVGMSILGIKIRYDLVLEYEEEYLPDGGFAQRSRLLSNPSGNLYESFSSWYVLPVVVDGKDCVYVRGFSRPGIRKAFPGMAGAIRTFTPGEVKDLLERYVKEARKRAGS